MALMELFLPFNSVGGDRKHDATGLSEIIRAILTTGVIPSPGGGFFATAKSGWAINLAPGRCVIEGRIGINNAPISLTVAPPNGTQDRIDRIVLRCDYERRLIEEVVKTGTPAATPAPPALQRDIDAYEISVARIFVGRNAASITQGVITDERPFESVCGFVAQVAPLDTESLFRQYEAVFGDYMTQQTSEVGAWRAQQTADFAAWYSGLQNILSGDVAANLSSRLSTAEQGLTTLKSASVLEASRVKVTVPTTGWAKNDALDLWEKVVAVTWATADTDIDVVVTGSQIGSAPLIGCMPGSGKVTLYASYAPVKAFEATIIVRKVGF